MALLHCTFSAAVWVRMPIRNSIYEWASVQLTRKSKTFLLHCTFSAAVWVRIQLDLTNAQDRLSRLKRDKEQLL